MTPGSKSSTVIGAGGAANTPLMMKRTNSSGDVVVGAPVSALGTGAGAVPGLAYTKRQGFLCCGRRRQDRQQLLKDKKTPPWARLHELPRKKNAMKRELPPNLEEILAAADEAAENAWITAGLTIVGVVLLLISVLS